MSRQNYYRQRRVRQRSWVDEQLVLELVRRERARQPQLGGRKLLRLIEPELHAADASVGRDRFFKILKEHELLIPRRPRTARTTDSRHGFAVYPNRARSLMLSGPHQLWVSDITYLRTQMAFVYLALVMDAFSRTVVGYDCSDRLEAIGALRALSMARGQLPADARPMHHSDQGIQYCCRAYIEALQQAKLSISMTEDHHCYENARAERLNGTLKRELGLAATFGNPAQAREAVDEAVQIYNHHRPHQALGYRMPMQVHRGPGPGSRSRDVPRLRSLRRGTSPPIPPKARQPETRT